MTLNNKEIEKLFDINVLHGRYFVSILNDNFKDKMNSLEVNVDDNICVCTVTDEESGKSSPLRDIKIKNNKINFLTVKTYEKWISKIQTLYDFIHKNYNELPKYFMYLDGHDTLILKDITNIDKLLDFYQCKILFNYEPYFKGTGYLPPYKMYLSGYIDLKRDYLKMNQKKYGIYHEFSLNAGVFIGEKEYVYKILKETIFYMKSDVNKGFPHGCTDDQYILRYLHNKYYSIMSIDFFSKLTFWGCAFTFKHPIGDEHFELDYSKSLLSEEQYLNNLKKYEK